MALIIQGHYDDPLGDETLCGVTKGPAHSLLPSFYAEVVDNYYRLNPDDVTCPDCLAWVRAGATLQDRSEIKKCLKLSSPLPDNLDVTAIPSPFTL